MLLRFIVGTSESNRLRPDNANQTHLVLASGKLILQKQGLARFRRAWCLITQKYWLPISWQSTHTVSIFSLQKNTTLTSGSGMQLGEQLKFLQLIFTVNRNSIQKKVSTLGRPCCRCCRHCCHRSRRRWRCRRRRRLSNSLTKVNKVFGRKNSEET